MNMNMNPPPISPVLLDPGGITSSWLLSTFGLLAVLFRLLLRLMLTVASDFER